MSDIFFFAGLAAAVAGVALLSVPAALIAGGLVCAVLGLAGASRGG